MTQGQPPAKLVLPTTRKVKIMTSFNAPVCAPSAELSIAAAMGGIRLAPVSLDGTLRSGLSVAQVNDARLVGFERAEKKRQAAYEKALAAEIAEQRERALAWDRKVAERLAEEKAAEISLEEGEVLTADLRDQGGIVEIEGDLAEVVAIITDAAGDEWVRIALAETGDICDYRMAEWQDAFGVDGENEILNAWDRAEVARMRSELIAA